MTDHQIALLYQCWQSDDFRAAIEEICMKRREEQIKAQGLHLSHGDMPQACIARGQAIAWELMPKLLERAGKKGAPDKS